MGFYINDFVKNNKIMKVGKQEMPFSLFIFELGKKSMNNPGIQIIKDGTVVYCGCFDGCFIIILANLSGCSVSYAAQ